MAPQEKLKKQAIRKKLLALIGKSRNLASACAAVGISYEGMRKKCKRDKKFARQVEQAKQKRIGLLEDMALEAAKVDPPTLRWLLANLDREHYAQRPEPQTPNANVNVTINDPIFMSAEQRRAILVSLMGQPAAALESGSAQSVDESAGNQTLDGNAARSDSPDAGKILPSSPVAKANGHAGNGRH